MSIIVLSNHTRIGFWVVGGLSKAKHFLTAMSQKKVCPQDEIADPPGTAVVPTDRHGFAEGLVSFCTLCSVESSLVRFALNRAISWGPPQWQAP